MVTQAQLLQQRGIAGQRSRAMEEVTRQRRIAQQQIAMKAPTGPTPMDYTTRGKEQTTQLERVIISKKEKVTLYKEQFEKASKTGKARSIESAERRLIRAEETLSALEGMKGKAATGEYRYEDLVAAAQAEGIYHLKREQEKVSYIKQAKAETKRVQTESIAKLEKEGFKPIYSDGKLWGYDDPRAQMSIPVAEFERHYEKKYEDVRLAAAPPLVAYRDIYTGEMEYVSKAAPSPRQVPVAISVATGKELGVVEQMRLSAERPELFRRAPVPLPSVIIPERFREYPKPAYIPEFGTELPEVYRETQIIPTELPISKPVYQQVGPVISTALLASGKLAAAAIPDYGPGIKVVEARTVPAGWVEKPAYIPEFGTYISPEQRIKEWEEEKVYDPKYIFGAERVKEAVEFGVPLGIGLAAWQAVPLAIVAPLIAGVSAVEIVKAQKEITELKEQKIDIKDIEAEVSHLKADIGTRPVGVTNEDWNNYRKEALDNIEKYRIEYLAEAERYNKEIEEAIKSQRITQVVGVAGVGLGATIGGRQIVKYAKGVITKPLPYKVPKPKREEIQWMRIDPKTGEPITEGVYGIRQEIPAQKALVQKRWEKWLGREPKPIELTKAKEKFMFTPAPITERVPGLTLETRAVLPATLRKFALGERALVLKPKIVGGVSAPTTLSELRALPKHQQELWRRMATNIQEGRIASIERTPSILKKFQNTKSKVITYDPSAEAGKRMIVTDVVTITKPIKKVTKEMEFGLITKKIPEDIPVEFFKGETMMKDITKATGMPPRMVGKMPEMEEKIMRFKKLISDEPSKVWGKTYPKPEKVPTPKVVAEMAPLKHLPTPPLSVIKVPTPKVVIASTEPSVITKVAAPSVWAGTGLYERAEVGLMPGVILGVPLPLAIIPEPKIEIDTISARIITPKFKPSVRVEPKLEIVPELKPEIKRKIIPRIMPALKPVVRVITKPAVREITKPMVWGITKPAVRVITIPTMIRPTPYPKPPIPPKPGVSKIKPPIIIFPDKKKPKMIRKEIIRPIVKVGYEVEVKRKGKWEDITPYALSKGEALALGRKITKAGAEVSFRLKKGDGVGGTMGLIPISEAELKEEYRGKIVKGKEVKEPQTFIQKRKARIATKGEFLAITAKGIAARKAKAKIKKRVIKW